MWVFLILVYGIFKGLRESLKKKALEKNGIYVVLFFYSLISFVLVIPFSRNIFDVNFAYHVAIFIKSFIIFIAWICAFNSIKKLPLSIYGIVDTCRVVFSILLGIVLLGERIEIMQIVGMVLVITGITIANLKSKKSIGEQRPKKIVYVLVLISCVLNAVSAIMDKWLLSPPNTDKNWLVSRKILGDGGITTSQLQFWYIFYLTALLGIFLLIRREKVDVKKVLSDPAIWALSILFVVADRCLFIANSYEEAKVVVMQIIKQSSVLVTILMGKILYKEKHIAYRIACAILIITGIVITVI
jgi:drug/metabolite transporter (DMT)-like permease